jgi:hypothetical protein
MCVISRASGLSSFFITPCLTKNKVNVALMCCSLIPSFPIPTALKVAEI